MRVLETELLGVGATASPALAELLVDGGADRRLEAKRRVGDAFAALVGMEGVDVEEVELERAGRYDSVLFGRERGAKIAAFSFSGFASDIVVPLFSALVALGTGTFGSGSTGDLTNAVVALWRNFSLLREPEDADAIGVIRTIVEVRAQRGGFVNDYSPTTDEIVAAGALIPASVVAALRTLRERRILEVDAWGGQRGDEADGGNRWTFRA